MKLKSAQKKYDVFLSFRGEDTRDTFTSYLHAALLRKKLEIYIDYRLERGQEIGPALLEAIEKSSLSVIIFSKNYASSTWCLDELAHILGCKESHGQFVIPIFYDIDPSDVRKQKGSYEDTFVQLEDRFKDKVVKWRAALEQAGKISGFDNLKKKGTEADFVEKVVQDILTKLNCKSSSDLKGLIGIESHIQKIESLLYTDSPDDVCTVGIWGMGGIGKTTLAEAVFYRLSSKFEASCFLANVRENSEEKDGLIHLRNKLLRQILDDEDLIIDTPSIGSDLVKRRLLSTRVIIVLDDVNDSRQLELLHGGDVCFGPGSRIIITTRDRRPLIGKVADAKIYEVKGLKDDEALRLFHLHAFQNKSPTTDYTKFSRKVVEYVKGIPLALKILGGLFLRCNTADEWEKQVNKLKIFPDEELQNVLRLSYNALGKNEQETFLDIACFLKGMDMDFAKRMVVLHGFSDDGIRDLIDKSLISVSTTNCLEMHDLLQEMGWTIVREQCRNEAGRRNRLWAAEDVYHVLQNHTGTDAVQSIFFDTNKMSTKLHLCGSAFEKMYHLRSLKIHDRNLHFQYFGVLENLPTFLKSMYHCMFGEVCTNNFDLSQGLKSLPNALRYLDWSQYPFKSLPSKYSPENLVELRMPNSKIKQPWNEGQSKFTQNLGNLKVIDLRNCQHLTKVPDLSRSRKIEHLDLGSCTSLVQFPCYFEDFDKLTYLNLGDCKNLCFFPGIPGNIQSLNLSGTAIKQLPSSIKEARQLSRLCINNCKSLESLPELPPSLQWLDALYCISLKTVSSSGTALRRGWDEYVFSPTLNEVHVYTECRNLDEIARSNIMTDAKIKIMRMATASLKFKVKKAEEASYDPDDEQESFAGIFDVTSSVKIVCPGNQIPKWFKHRGWGDYMTIKLAPDWFRPGFMGFALCAVAKQDMNNTSTVVRCRYEFVTKDGELRIIKTNESASYVKVKGSYIASLTAFPWEDSSHVLVWYNVFELEKGGKFSAAFYKLVTKLYVRFYHMNYVRVCGIRLLYDDDGGVDDDDDEDDDSDSDSDYYL